MFARRHFLPRFFAARYFAGGAKGWASVATTAGQWLPIAAASAAWGGAVDAATAWTKQEVDVGTLWDDGPTDWDDGQTVWDTDGWTGRSAASTTWFRA